MLILYGRRHKTKLLEFFKKNMRGASFISTWGLEDFMVFSDVSKMGLGYVLMERRKLMAYVLSNSRNTRRTIRIRVLKLVAAAFALKLLRHYLYGTKCNIFTDYKSLKYIFQSKVT